MASNKRSGNSGKQNQGGMQDQEQPRYQPVEQADDEEIAQTQRSSRSNNPNNASEEAVSRGALGGAEEGEDDLEASGEMDEGDEESGDEEWTDEEGEELRADEEGEEEEQSMGNRNNRTKRDSDRPQP